MSKEICRMENGNDYSIRHRRWFGKVRGIRTGIGRERKEMDESAKRSDEGQRHWRKGSVQEKGYRKKRQKERSTAKVVRHRSVLVRNSEREMVRHTVSSLTSL